MTELTGLTAPEVRARVEQGQVNALRVRSTKSVGRIVTDNVFSLFNLVIFALGALVLAVGRWEQTLFVFAALGNTAVGIVQELRTKFTIERLSLLTDKNAVVLRDGQEQTVPQHEIVRDDIVCLRTGAQIVVDGDIVEGGVLVSEALITGESDALAKNTGDEVLSGSFAVGGSARMRVRHIGGENYAVRLAAAVKKFHPAHSEIIHTLRLIIRAVAIALIPLGALLAWRQWSLTQSFADTVLGSAASLVSLIPEGLVLLTTTVFAVAVFRLARHKVLVQELYAVEALARVDVLCIDKTGTLTEGRMTVAQVHPLTGEDIHTPLSAFCRALDDTSPTFAALSAYFTQDPGWLASDTKAFSSACPYSAVTFDGKQYRLGAPECLIEPD
ncbi:MAG: HAD-IC family P-type ATPase, partial [Oscillospiraceae bacterium]|nr:HAD-IC family P-type ATPase [Oscillospiraceae bacterium]